VQVRNLGRGERWIRVVFCILRCSPSNAVVSTVAVAALREIMRCKDRIPRGSQYQPSRPSLGLRHWPYTTSLDLNSHYRLIQPQPQLPAGSWAPLAPPPLPVPSLLVRAVQPVHCAADPARCPFLARGRQPPLPPLPFPASAISPSVPLGIQPLPHVPSIPRYHLTYSPSLNVSSIP
jgi:hypothetical protein